MYQRIFRFRSLYVGVAERLRRQTANLISHGVAGSNPVLYAAPRAAPSPVLYALLFFCGARRAGGAARRSESRPLYGRDYAFFMIPRLETRRERLISCGARRRVWFLRSLLNINSFKKL